MLIFYTKNINFGKGNLVNVQHIQKQFFYIEKTYICMYMCMYYKDLTWSVTLEFLFSEEVSMF